jgi:hypothetical protein
MPAWEVDCISDIRVRAGRKVEFYVQWVNFGMCARTPSFFRATPFMKYIFNLDTISADRDDDTWEPGANMLAQVPLKVAAFRERATPAQLRILAIAMGRSETSATDSPNPGVKQRLQKVDAFETQVVGASAAPHDNAGGDMVSSDEWLATNEMALWRAYGAPLFFC